jgi:hypothetical protein
MRLLDQEPAAAACPPQSDPLKETLDGVLPLVEEGAEALGTVPTSVPQSIEEARPCCHPQRRIKLSFAEAHQPVC